MFVNNFKINIFNVDSGSTATTINIPINLEYQLVDQSEIVDRVFVDVETEKAINTTIDYEKARFIPIDYESNLIYKIDYLLDFDGATTYGSIGFTIDDLVFRKEVFKQTFLNLDFYDSDNPLTQNLVNNITIFSEISKEDLSPTYGTIGIPKPPDEIPLRFTLNSELLNPRGFTEGFYLYDYKDEIPLNGSKYLYMRASFKNAKSGTTTNMMVKNNALPIDELVHELYTRFELKRTDTGYYYVIDKTYQGNEINNRTNNNVLYSTNPNTVSVFLNQIKAL